MDLQGSYKMRTERKQTEIDTKANPSVNDKNHGKFLMQIEFTRNMIFQVGHVTGFQS